MSIKRFTSTGNRSKGFQAPVVAVAAASSGISANILVVGGGGGGATTAYGFTAGGGGGGFQQFEGFILAAGTQYTITVGGGGNGAVTTTTRSGVGGFSSIVSPLYSIYSQGGGAAYWGTTGSPSTPTLNISNWAGGSGGGCLSTVDNSTHFITGQGNRGGTYVAPGAGSGGGGAGAAGPVNTSPSVAGPGGIGKQNSYLGTTYYFAGGGGGGNATPTGGGSGGNGGGGGGVFNGTGGSGLNAGSNAVGTTPGPGGANTGGGGGAGWTTGALGGSGIVVFQVAATLPVATTTGTVTVSPSGVYRIYNFTGSGTITF